MAPSRHHAKDGPMESRIVMSQHERDVLAVMNRVLLGERTQSEAAGFLHLSEGQKSVRNRYLASWAACGDEASFPGGSRNGFRHFWGTDFDEIRIGQLFELCLPISKGQNEITGRILVGTCRPAEIADVVEERGPVNGGDKSIGEGCLIEKKGVDAACLHSDETISVLAKQGPPSRDGYPEEKSSRMLFPAGEASLVRNRHGSIRAERTVVLDDDQLWPKAELQHSLHDIVINAVDVEDKDIRVSIRAQFHQA